MANFSPEQSSDEFSGYSENPGFNQSVGAGNVVRRLDFSEESAINQGQGCGAPGVEGDEPPPPFADADCPMDSFQDMKVKCPYCTQDCRLQIEFRYFGLNPANPIEQEIRYRIGLVHSGDGRGQIPAESADASNLQAQANYGINGQLCPPNPPYEFQAVNYQSFDRIGVGCPYCRRQLSIKVGFSYIGVNQDNPQEHELKLRIKLTGERMKRLPPAASYCSF